MTDDRLSDGRGFDRVESSRPVKIDRILHVSEGRPISEQSVCGLGKIRSRSS